jgi:transcriptional regulator GlxA family with amidase domain
MSVRNFSRTFAREFKSTPAKFIARLRVETAKRLLEDSAKGSERIAAECGFGSVDSMQRAFRQQTGKAPAAFRRSIFTSAALPLQQITKSSA